MAPLVEDRQTTENYIDESDRVLLDDTLGGVTARGVPVEELPGLEPCGPRRKIFFDPRQTRAAIVTCGGLCPGLNNVIRSVTRELFRGYGVKSVLGIRGGYRGLDPNRGKPPLELSEDMVEDIHKEGGTMLGTSRG